MKRLKMTSCRTAAMSFAAVLAAGLASAAVYVKPLAEGEEREATDGRGWETAFTTIEAALAAAADRNEPIYAAQGVYVLPQKTTVTVSFELYGGFPGLSAGETPDDRDPDRWQTILTGDAGLDDVWEHCEPKLGEYGAKTTGLTDRVIQAGRVALPPAFAGDYDVYYAKIVGSNRTQAFDAGADVSMTFDGVWITGWASAGNYGAFLTKGGAGTVTMRRCRLVGNRGAARGVLYLTGTASAVFTDTLFGFGTSTENGCIRNNAQSVFASNCVFRSFHRSGLSTGGSVLYGQDRDRYVNCLFTRSFDITTSPGNGYSGMGNITGGDGGWLSFFGCTFSNNLSVTSGQYGNPLLAKAQCVKGCAFVNNRYETKPASGHGYALLGYASAANDRPFLVDGCLFKGNAVTAPGVTAAGGDYYLGLIGQNVSSSGKGQPFSVVNCVFDANVASFSHAPVAGLTPHLCRGPYVLNTVQGAKGALGVANCTFRGPQAEGLYDIAQYGADDTQPLYVVNSLFLSDEDDVVSNGLHAERPSVVSAFSCSFQNLSALPEGIACEGLASDAVPLDAAHVPQARVPDLRRTADVSTNELATADRPATFAFRPHGEEAWRALVPRIAAKVSNTGLPIGDLHDVPRPVGSSTRGAVQPLADVAETGRTLTLRRSPLASGHFGASPNAVAVPIGGTTPAVTAVPVDANVSFAGWYTPAGELYASDPTLQISGLAEDLVLEARFRAKTVTLTFDLGDCGTFEDGGRTATLEAEYNALFPDIPPYALDPAWVAISWGTPERVPTADTTYRLRCVSSSVRVVRVVPGGAGRGDGTDWDNAYGDIAAAVADAGLYRGEVWIRTGVYRLEKAVPLAANVTVRGGFAGDETTADQADPEAHPVLLTGDLRGDDRWRINAGGTGDPIFDYAEDGTFVYRPPNPEGTDDYWVTGVNASDNADFGLTHMGETNVCVSGVMVASFARSCVVSTSARGRGLRFEKCRFIAGNASHQGDNGASENYDIGAVNISGTDVTFEDCTFEGCAWAYRFSSTLRATNTLRRCAFVSNAMSAKASTVRTMGAACLEMEGCRFTRNCNDNEKHEAATCLVLDGSGESRFVDCLFDDNRNRGTSHGLVLTLGASSTFERCRFVGNSTRLTGYYNAAATVFCAYYTGGLDVQHLVRDCHFASNALDAVSADDIWAGVASCRTGERWTFLNCSVEDFSFACAGQTSLFRAAGQGALAIVNCGVRGTTSTDWTRTADLRVIGSPVVTVLNSAFGSGDAAYVPLVAAEGAKLRAVQSVLQGLDETSFALDAAGGFFGIDTQAPRFTKTQRGPNGAEAFGVRLVEACRGAKTCLAGREACYREEPSASGTPWRRAWDLSAALPDAPAGAAPVRDAFGATRPRRFGIGACVQEPLGLALLVR